MLHILAALCCIASSVLEECQFSPARSKQVIDVLVVSVTHLTILFDKHIILCVT